MTPSTTTMPQPQLPQAHAAACWLPVVLWFCGMSIGRAQGNAVIIDIPKPVVLPGDAVQRLHSLVAQRTVFFQAQKFAEGNRRHDYFAAEKLWQERQSLIRPLNRQLKVAQVGVARAALQVQRNRNLATGHAGRGMGRDVAAAEENLKAAKAKLDQIQARLNILIGQIQPLENYLQGARPKWAEIYSQMGQLVPRDATDPLAKAVADAWDAAGANENDFVEADVLGAVSKIYAGDQVSAEKLLQRASNLLKASQLHGLPVAVDCCHGWLLLGKPRMCQDYVTFLKNLPDTATAIGQDWAIGLHAYADRKLNGGADDFSRAVGKAIKLRKALAQEAPPALWGDAVVSLLQTDEVNAGRGRNFFKTAGPVVVSDGCWQVLRARAMIAADAADWKPAVALLEVCAERAPGAMQAELADHLAAHRQQQVWNVRDWTRVAAAGVPVNPVPAPQPPPLALAGDDADPRYTYDGAFPRSDFRIRFDELRNQTDIASVMRWREVLRAVFASGLTLNETDWAEHCLDSNEPAESLDSDETIRLQKYVELTADGA
jgi:hypothetical protein